MSLRPDRAARRDDARSRRIAAARTRDGSGRASRSHLLTQRVADRFFALLLPVEADDDHFARSRDLAVAPADLVHGVQRCVAHLADADADVDRLQLNWRAVV